ncbi:MAG: holo-ACP synthase [Novosphingobium sp.]
MIIGVGADILQIERLRRSLAKFGKGYLEEVYSEDELATAIPPSYLTEAEFHSRAFCAKEACSKALGTGIDENVDWYDIIIDQLSQPPKITLFGGALTRLETLTPPNFQAHIALTVGGNDGIASAYVVISAQAQG